METKHKNREQEASRPIRKKAAAAPPKSAQQRNGAARSAQEQRTGAPKKQEQPRRTKESPQKRASRQPPEAAPKKKKVSALSLLVPRKKTKPAGKTQQPRKKRTAPETEVSEKRRRYGNSKPKKTPVSSISEIYKQYTASDDAQGAAKPKAQLPMVPTPPVIYTEPKTFNRNRLLIQLATITAVVAAVIMGISVFFKVEEIRVSGAEVYSVDAVQEHSGIKVGDNLLTFSRPRAGALIKANLPYVDTVRFGIKLPGTVNIIIEEDNVVYAIKDQNGQWWLMNSDGRVVKQSEGNQYANHTQILGVTLESPVPNNIGVATEAVPTQTNANGELMPVTTENSKKLNAAKQIVQALEANDIVGSAASVDVSRIDDIILWYGTRYQVNLGDDANLDYKIACMDEVIRELNDYQSGILDISFTIWPSQVGYTPFS